MPTAYVRSRPQSVIPRWIGGHQIPGPAGTDVSGSPNAPVGPRRVRLHDQASGALVREEWSDASTGNVRMSHLPAGTYYMLAFDHTGAFGGVVETDIVAEPMTGTLV